MSGETIELAALKGKVVFLTFWSSRCAICQNEIPNLNKIAVRYSNKNIVFIGITTENESVVDAYLKHHPFDLKIIPNAFDILLKYADHDKEGRVIMAFPTYFIIDRSGFIQYKESGWDKSKRLDEAISKALLSQ